MRNRSSLALLLIACVVLLVSADASALSFTRTDLGLGLPVSSHDTKDAGGIWDPMGWFGLTGGGLQSSISYYSDGAKSVTSASLMRNISWQVWEFGSTRDAYDHRVWTEAFRLNGSPGEHAEIFLTYDLFYVLTGYAADGRSKSSTAFSMIYGVDRIPVPLFGDAGYDGTVGDSKVQNLYMVGLVPGDSGHLQNTISLGEIWAGEYMALTWWHNSDAETQAYGPGVTGAFMYSDFEYSLSYNALPVAEPATLLLLGAGLLGMAAYGRKRFHR